MSLRYPATDSKDTFTDAHVAISGDHSYIHQGKKFTGLIETNILQAGKYYLLLTTPAASAGYVHLRPTNISAIASGVKVRLYKGLTTTSGGSAVTLINSNHNSTETAGTTLKKGASATAEAAKLVAHFAAGSGGGPTARGGGSAAAAEEIVLEPATEYTFEFEEVDSGATDVLITIAFYEEASG